MSVHQDPEFRTLICPADGKILGEYCKTASGEYECPRCRNRFDESEVDR